MKIRSDFVTNSSSSSFIIGKREDSGVTVDSVFQKLKEFYRDYDRRVQALKANMDKFGLIFDTNQFKFSDPEISWSKKDKINDKIEKKYGVDIWCYIPDISEWIDFVTYAEYQDHWAQKIQDSDPDKYIHAPFSIFDFSNPDSSYLGVEGGDYCLENPSSIENMNRHVTGWYIPCVDHRINGDLDPEDDYYCDSCPFWPSHSEKCKDVIHKIGSGEITPTNSVSILLGKVCVHSECGYIPENIVESLRQISQHSCNHMG